MRPSKGDCDEELRLLGQRQHRELPGRRRIQNFLRGETVIAD
jgi:hypothetical protein